jgi:hypothetical protein
LQFNAKLQPLVKAFLILLKQQHPRLLLQVVLNNKQKLDLDEHSLFLYKGCVRRWIESREFYRKKIIKELFNGNSDLIRFAHANNCQDLLPPPSQFTTLYNTLTTNISSIFWNCAVERQPIMPIANFDSEKQSPLLVARAVSGIVDLEEAKGCPTATVVKAPASKISNKAPRKPVPFVSNMVAYLPVAPTTPVEQTKQKPVEKRMVMQ